ncbi:hypothetical protein SKAU_G00133490 [Synaphobranchus kaupii]|uniref:Uncharacterized protein n=1 Tax=Synaphobranchus kaupii TaxID=118154 RepID=A0A9Q1J3J8_SYNKA|nr:hypothetical protein SKAU_G00133490 [Synaphobranchus kaupii]
MDETLGRWCSVSTMLERLRGTSGCRHSEREGPSSNPVPAGVSAQPPLPATSFIMAAGLEVHEVAHHGGR